MKLDMRDHEARDFLKEIMDEIMLASACGYADVLDLFTPYAVERILNSGIGHSITYDKDDDGRVHMYATLPDGTGYGRILGYACEN